jgi:hypothetical protein
MEVGQAATYVDLAGKPQDCLIAKIENGKASIVVVNVDGPSDPLGRLRRELDGVRIGTVRGCVMDLDSYNSAPKTEPKTATKKSTKKKAAKKKAGE